MEKSRVAQDFIEIQEYNPEFEDEFQKQVLNRYLTETYNDLLNREANKEAKKVTFKVFAEVSGSMLSSSSTLTCLELSQIASLRLSVRIRSSRSQKKTLSPA